MLISHIVPSFKCDSFISCKTNKLITGTRLKAAMYKIIWMALFLFMSSNATAVWTKIVDARDNTEGSNQGSLYSVYTDVDTMRNSNNLIKVWELYDYQKVQSGRYAKPFLSLKVRTEYDCSGERSRAHYVAIFSENMGKGNRGGEKEYVHNWESLEPDTVGEKLWRFACGK